MSRYIRDLTPGIPIYIDETVSGVTNHILFIYLGPDANNNHICLREEAAVQKRAHSSNYASYDGCESDVWMNNEESGYLSRFDEETRSYMTYASIGYCDYNLNDEHTAQYATITRRAFSLSRSNVGYASTAEGPSFLDALKTYYNTTNANTARIGKNSNKTAVYWWLRSGASQTACRIVHTSGSEYSNNATNGSFWLRPALSFSEGTPVSDEGADAIFLLPEGRRTYWSISAIAKLGSPESRPASAKLEVLEHNLTTASYAVSNNADDEMPIWTPIENGGVADFANTERSADHWQLGVKIEAQASTSDGYVGQPALIVASDPVVQEPEGGEEAGDET